MATQKALDYFNQRYPWLQPVTANGRLPAFAAVPGLGELPSPDDPLYGAWLGLQSPDVQEALAGTFGYSAPVPPREEFTPFQQAIANQYDPTQNPAAAWRDATAGGGYGTYPGMPNLGPAVPGAGFGHGDGGLGYSYLQGGGGAAPNGDLRGWWDTFTQGKNPGPNFLQENRAAIEAAGWRLENPNAAGVVSKLINPQTGEIIRVLNNADNPSAGVSFSWMPQSGGGGGGGAGGGVSDPNAPGGFTEPFREQFSYADFAPPADFVAPTWTAPTDITAENDVGYQDYQRRLQRGQQAIERAASSKGTLLTGGTAKDLLSYAQDEASAEYQNVYTRHYGEYQSDYAKKWGEYLQNYQQEAGEWETGYNKALGEYQQRYGIFQGNQGNAYNRLMGVAQLGLQGTNAQAQLGLGYAQNYGSILGNYGNTQSNLITGAGNATAAGQAAGGSAWGNALANTGNQAAQSLYGYSLLNSPAFQDYYRSGLGGQGRNWLPTTPLPPLPR